MISIRRVLIVVLAAVVSAYHLLLGWYSLPLAQNVSPYILAMALYAFATTLSLWPVPKLRMPTWMAVLNVAVCVAVPLLVAPQLNVHGTIGSDYSTWYPAAIGTLMVITSARERHFLAWSGVLFLAVHTVIWAGFGALVTLGVAGSLLWVAISHVLSISLTNIGNKAQRYVIAEREAAEWQAAQDAHLFERQLRLRQTNRMALPMLRLIVLRDGALTESQRTECFYLEAAIRDEIRGRKLLNDRVRAQVMRARRRGTAVTLLDEGGIDNLLAEDLERVLNSLADAIGDSRADKVIVRTAAEELDVAVTVVGLRSAEGAGAGVLGGSEEDEVELWLEIPR